MSKHPLSEHLHLTEAEARTVLLGLDRLRLIIHKELAATGRSGELDEDLDRVNLVSGKVATILEYYAANKERTPHAPDQVVYHG